MQSKKGIELSVNFIVMLILAIVTLVLSLAFFGKIFSGANDIRDTVDQDVQQQLRDRIFSSTEQIVIYPSDMEITGKQGAVFGVGILNIDTSAQQFSILVSIDKCYSSTGTALAACPSAKPLVQYDSSAQQIAANQRGLIEVYVGTQSGTPPGKYALTVTIKKSSNVLSKSIAYVTVY